MITVEQIPYDWVKKELTFDGPYKKGDKGPKVSLIQEWVSLHKEPRQQVSIDGDFGPATESAVRLFQKAQALPENGIVDETTFRKLTEPILQVLTPLPASQSFAEMVVSYAEKHLQYHPLEIGGQNRGPWVRLYMHGNQGTDWPWCAGFVCFMLRQAADTLGLSLPLASTFSCDVLSTEAQEKGSFVSEDDLAQGNPPFNEMLPGSIFLNRKSRTDWTHTGLVIAFHDDTFETIEGNTNDDGCREGYEVCARIRGYGDKDFIRIT